MALWIWIALGAVAVLIVVGLLTRGARRARTTTQHTVETSRTHVARASEIRKYDIRPLTTAERDRYQREWTRIEHRFVTRPAAAVVEAGELLADVMRVQGYPMDDFEKHAAQLSVKYPRVVEHYRAGHRTEDRREAMRHYRSLFEELLGGADFEREVPRENELRVIQSREDGEGSRPRDDRDVSRRP